MFSLFHFFCNYIFSLVEQCELWLPGRYNVTITLCYGQCGSHHPHTKLYDVTGGSFFITQ